ncbi:MAG: M23 family metallopeptidase [Verrucomicrobiales bacterium]
MQNPNAKQIVLLTVVIFAALALVFSLILKNSFDFRGLSMKEMPGRRLAYGADGKALPNDPALILTRPIELARTPIASRLDMPMGSEHGALTYDFQPFMTLNPERGGRHLGDDLNGIGGMDTDLGDPVYAIGAGRVIYSADAHHGWGNVIIVAHRMADGERFLSFYGHLDRRDFGTGSEVVRGEQIGTVGKGGGAYPAHLHFEVRDSICPNPGRGYFTSALNRWDPSGTVRDRRGAPDDLLNSAPRERLEAPHIDWQ